MKKNDERLKRWLVRLLGKLVPGGREHVAAEMRARLPEEAENLRAVVDGVTQWAKEPVPYKPTDLQELQQEVSPYGRAVRTRGSGFFSSWPAWACTLAAAAALVFALSHVQFSVVLGDRVLHWGRGLPEGATGGHPTKLAALEQRVTSLEQAAEEARSQIYTLAMQNILMHEEFRNAARRLAESQYAVAQSCYRDIGDLMQSASYARNAQDTHQTDSWN